MSEDKAAAEKYLPKLIDKLISSASSGSTTTLNINYLRNLKELLKNDDEMLRETFSYIMTALSKKNATTRIGCLHLIDYLFTRSVLFRQLLLETFQDFLGLTVGINGNPLPPPSDKASALKELTIRFVATWNEKYGASNRALSLGYNYLQRNESDGKLEFAVRTDYARKQRDQERKERLRGALVNKFDSFLETIEEATKEAEGILKQMNELFHILVPPVDYYAVDGSQTSGQSSLMPRELVAVEVKAGRPLDIAETAENSVLYDNLRELYRVLQVRVYMYFQKWINVLLEVEIDPADECRRMKHDEFLSQGLDIRNNISTVMTMCDDLGIYVDEDDEEMIEVPMEGSTAEIDRRSNTKKRRIERSEPSKTGKKPFIPQDAPGSSTMVNLQTETETDTDPDRKALLDQAPFVEYDDDLYFWDKEEIQFNTSGLEFHHRFLGEGSGENLLSKKTVDSLKQRRIYYTDLKNEGATKLKQCRYPMKNGVCPRLHAHECTFHGVIVPRDETGVPKNEEDKKKEEKKDVPFWDQLEMELKMGLKGKKKEKAEATESTLDRLKNKISNPSARRRVASEVSKQDSLRLRDRQAFKW